MIKIIDVDRNNLSCLLDEECFLLEKRDRKLSPKIERTIDYG